MIGYFFSQKSNKNNQMTSSETSRISLESTSSNADLKIKEKPIKLHEVKATEPKQIKIESVIIKEKNRIPASTVKTEPEAEQKKPQERELTLNDAIVRQMESQWYQLPQMVKMNREQRGWRVHYVNQNSVFAEAGFRQNDLITDKAIYSLQDQNSKSNGLAHRLIRILNHVQ